MPEQVTRAYGGTDADMLQLSSTMHGHFLEDQNDFFVFNEKFEDPYPVDWQDAITAADGLPTDEEVDDQLEGLTTVVTDAMNDCRDKFQDTKPFVEDAFPEKVSVWKEFGFDDYDKVRNTQAQFIQFMLRFHRVAKKYKVLLDGANYPQARIDEILTLAEALKEADVEQELFKGNIPNETRDRIITLNDCYAFTSEVARAGKLIYRKNFAKYQRYLLGPGSEDPEVFNITGTATDAVAGGPLANVVVSIPSLAIETTTNSEGLFGFGALDAGNYELQFNLEGYDPLLLNVEVVEEETTVADAALTPE